MPFLLPDLSAVLCRKQEMMMLSLELPPSPHLRPCFHRNWGSLSASTLTSPARRTPGCMSSTPLGVPIPQSSPSLTLNFESCPSRNTPYSFLLRSSGSNKYKARNQPRQDVLILLATFGRRSPAVNIRAQQPSSLSKMVLRETGLVQPCKWGFVPEPDGFAQHPLGHLRASYIPIL
jgi:hypothetical protein